MRRKERENERAGQGKGREKSVGGGVEEKGRKLVIRSQSQGQATRQKGHSCLAYAEEVSIQYNT